MYRTSYANWVKSDEVYNMAEKLAQNVYRNGFEDFLSDLDRNMKNLIKEREENIIAKQKLKEQVQAQVQEQEDAYQAYVDQSGSLGMEEYDFGEYDKIKEIDAKMDAKIAEIDNRINNIQKSIDGKKLFETIQKNNINNYRMDIAKGIQEHGTKQIADKIADSFGNAMKNKEDYNKFRADAKANISAKESEQDKAFKEYCKYNPIANIKLGRLMSGNIIQKMCFKMVMFINKNKRIASEKRLDEARRACNQTYTDANKRFDEYMKDQIQQELIGTEIIGADGQKRAVTMEDIQFAKKFLDVNDVSSITSKVGKVQSVEYYENKSKNINESIQNQKQNLNIPENAKESEISTLVFAPALQDEINKKEAKLKEIQPRTDAGLSR